jgi:hypothetical protein
MLSDYHYSMLHFVPRIGRGETVNVGVIVVDDATGRTAGAFLPDPSPKIVALAPGYNVANIAADIETIRHRVDRERQPGGHAWIRSSEQLRTLAGAMRNQLQLSEPRPCHAASLESAARELYDDFVRPIGASRSAERIGVASP